MRSAVQMDTLSNYAAWRHGSEVIGMRWTHAYHQGAAFPMHVVRPLGVYPILSILGQSPRMSPTDLLALLTTISNVNALLIGVQQISQSAVSNLLIHLHAHGLVVRCSGGAPGAHTRYSLTRLGAELLDALAPVTAWAMADFDFVVAATRVRLDLPPLELPVPRDIRQANRATDMAVSLLDGMWSNPVMVYVDDAGPRGIGPLRLETTMNADLAATSGAERVVRKLGRSAMYGTLGRLMAKGLIERYEDVPPLVRYGTSPHGRRLMEAWWRVADEWGIAHIPELFPIVAATSNWFEQPSEG